MKAGILDPGGIEPPSATAQHEESFTSLVAGLYGAGARSDTLFLLRIPSPAKASQQCARANIVQVIVRLRPIPQSRRPRREGGTRSPKRPSPPGTEGPPRTSERPKPPSVRKEPTRNQSAYQRCRWRLCFATLVKALSPSLLALRTSYSHVETIWDPYFTYVYHKKRRIGQCRTRTCDNLGVDQGLYQLS